MLHKNRTIFANGIDRLFICYLTSLSALNEIRPAAFFGLKKLERFCKVQKSGLFSTLAYKSGLILQLHHIGNIACGIKEI
jgi:hypothetical protein